MDHVPNTVRRAHNHIPVPYLFNEDWGYKYDNKGFFCFPKRQGWNSEDFLHSSSIQNKNKEKAASLLQAWLYFGFMSAALNREVDTNNFVEEVEGQRFINTKLLPEYIDDWHSEVAPLPEEEKEKRFQAFLSLCREADLYFRGAVESTPGDPSPTLPEGVQISLSILHATIVHAATHIFRNNVDPSPYDVSEFIHGIPVEPVKTLLRKQHWCPSDISLLEQGGLGSTSSLELYYAYLLGDRKIIRDHTLCDSTFKGQFVCQALNVNEEKYEQKHVDSCPGGCGFISVDEDWLGAVYHANLVPLVTVSLNDAGVPSLVTHKSNFTAGYVAISHVYADGLGNPHACGLPACQLKRLQSRVNCVGSRGTPDNSHSSNVPFWVDTLCIPVGSDSIRKAAIRKMADIYSMATAVLVLNGELEYHSCDTSEEEVIMRITTSAWFRRLWTLLEGVLANKLYFQLDNGSVEIESLTWPEEEEDSRFSILKRLRSQALKPYRRLRAFREMSREQRIRAIYPLIQWRATTHDADEPYCLALLLLEDSNAMHRITATKDLHERRVQFILGQRLFPVKSLFFCETRIGTRDPPIGWALGSYLYRSEPEAVYDGDRLALVDKEGLHIHLPGISLPIVDLPTKFVGQHKLPSFTLKDETADEGGSTRVKICSCFWLRDQNPPRVWTDLTSSFGAEKVGILFESWPPEYQKRLPGQRRFSPIRGAIVAIIEETREKITGFYCGTTVISRSSERIQTQNESIDFGAMPSLAELLGDELLKAPKRSAEDTQSWEILAGSHSGNDALLRQTAGTSRGADFFQENEEVVSGEYIETTKEWCVK